MTDPPDEIQVGARWTSTPYLLDHAAATRYNGAIEVPPRRAARRGIHDDREAARTAGFTAPIAAGEHTIAVIAQFIADKFKLQFLLGGRIEITLTRPGSL